MQIRYENSEKKKLVEQNSTVRQIEMRFLDKDSSRQYSQVMQEIMRTSLRKQSVVNLHKKKTSTKSFHKQYQTPPKQNNIVIVDSGLKQSKIEIKSEQKVVQVDERRKVPYKFSFKSFIIELFVAYSATFAILYFIKLANFPYYEIILCIAFTVSIDPWKSSSLLLLISIPIIIANFFMNLSYFTYPSIVICYYAVMSFNERYKSKQLFVLAFIFTIIYGLIILPAIYRSLQSKIAYYYIFPILMFIIRNIIAYCFWVIDHTAMIFLQLPLFITGLQYGTILTRDVSTIQFWYMIVFFSLQIINERTQFFLRIMVKIGKYCSSTKKELKEDKEKVEHNPILPAHANGYACLNSFHLFLLVYIYSQLHLYTAPYSSDTSFSIYTRQGYKPVVVWVLTSVYEVMSLILQKQSKNKLFFGYTSNKWWRCILRGFMLSLGMWMFYIGLGVGILTSQSY